MLDISEKNAPHTAVREWLTSKFGEKVISCFTERSWPAKSPDLSPMDYWFWSACLVELIGKILQTLFQS